MIPVHQETEVVFPGLFRNLTEVHTADIRKVRGLPENLVQFSLAEPDEQACGRACMQQKERKVQLKETQSIEKETHPGHAVYSRKTDAGGAA